MIPIKKVEQFGPDELILRLRRTTIFGRPDVRIYEKATIRVEKNVDPKSVPIPQRYVLAGQLEKLRSLDSALAKHGHDLCQLNGFLTVSCEDGYEPSVFDVLPPVVEWSEADKSWILNDGMHRMYYAMQNKRRTDCVFISDIPPEFPYYAYPLPDGWAEVTVLEQLTEAFKKKSYRIPNYKTLFRDFNSAFNNVTYTRKPGK